VTYGKNIYAVWHEFPTAASTQPDVFFFRGTNKGGGFSSRVNLGNIDPIDSRGEGIAVSRSNVFVAWSENVNGIPFRGSTNNGASFDPAKKLDPAIGAVHSQMSASGNDVYATRESLGQGGNTDIFFAQGR
jgi:hypothetical protein